MKWNRIKDIYKEAIVKFTHKILKNKNNIYDLLTINRTVRMISENKLGPRNIEVGNNTIDKKSFLYRIHDEYNEIPRSITLIKNIKLFKKWIESYYREGKIRKETKYIKDNTYIRKYLEMKICNGYPEYEDMSNIDG